MSKLNLSSRGCQGAGREAADNYSPLTRHRAGLILLGLFATIPLVGQDSSLIDLLANASPEFVGIQAYVVSPDSRFAAFVSSRAGDSGVFSVSVPDGEIRQLGPVEQALEHGSWDVAIAAGYERVLYRQGQRELWSVRNSDPSQAPANLMACIPGESHLYEYYVLGDQKTVLLDVRRDLAYGPRELYVIDAEGCGRRAERLNHVLRPGESVGVFSVSDDGSMASYTSAFPNDPNLDLWVTSVHEPQPRRVNGVDRRGPVTVSACEFPTTPDVCVFMGDLHAEGKVELYAADLSRGQVRAAKISGELPADVGVTKFEISRDAEWVVYNAANSSYWSPSAEVFSTPLLGPPAAARPLSAGNFSGDPLSSLVAITNDARSVFLGRHWPGAAESQLAVVPIEGSDEEPLPVSPRVGGDSRLSEARITPGADELLFAIASGGVPEIRCYLTSASGSRGEGLPLWTEVLFSPLPAAQGDCVANPSGTGAVSYLAHAEGPLTQRLLYWSSFDSPPEPRPMLLTPPEMFDDFNGIREDYEFLPDGRWLLFRGQSPDGPVSLWARAIPIFADGFETGTTLHWSLVPFESPR